MGRGYSESEEKGESTGTVGQVHVGGLLWLGSNFYWCLHGNLLEMGSLVKRS